jgi:hypothetical protein
MSYRFGFPLILKTTILGQRRKVTHTVDINTLCRSEYSGKAGDPVRERVFERVLDRPAKGRSVLIRRELAIGRGVGNKYRSAVIEKEGEQWRRGIGVY